MRKIFNTTIGSVAPTAVMDEAHGFEQGQKYYDDVAGIEYRLDDATATAAVWTVIGDGSVTSVALAMPGIFTVSGSPVTGAGTLTASLVVQNANKVWAGPATGADATPTFRALVNADIPTALSIASLITSGDVTVGGNLTVLGATTQLNSTVVNVDDRVITVNYSVGANDPVPAAIVGLSVFRGRIATVARDAYGLFWDETASQWKFAVNTGADDATLGAYLDVQAKNITAAQVTDSALTPTRVSYAGTAGLFVDDQYFTRTNGGTIGTGYLTIGNTTASTTTSTGALVVAGGLGVGGAINALSGTFGNVTNSAITATWVAYAGVAGLMAGDSGFTRTALALTVDPNTDNTFTTGYGKMGFVSGGTSTDFYLAQASCYNSSDYGFRQNSSGNTLVNAKSGAVVIFRVNNSTKATLSTSSLTVASGTTYIGSDTTDSTSGTTGAINTLGGVGITKALWVGTSVTAGTFVLAVGDSVTTSRFRCNGAVTTAAATGNVAMWRSGGTIGTAGDMIFQTDLAVAAGAFVFRSGQTTPVTIATIAVDGSVTFGTGTDTNLTTGYGKMGLATSGTPTAFYVAQSGNFTSSNFLARQLAAGNAFFNGVTSLALGISGTLKATLTTSLLSTATGVQFSVLDSTASTSSSTGCAIFAGGIGVAGAIVSAGNITANARFQSATGVTTAGVSGICGFWRSAGTIGTAGDMIFQSDIAVAQGAFVFRGGLTTPATVATISGAVAAGTTPGLALVGTSTITGGVTDGYNGSLRLTATYDAATALTVTRHNYIDVPNVALTGAGPAALTDACLFRFDAALGTHKATTNADKTGNAKVGTIKINENGTIRHIQLYAD